MAPENVSLISTTFAKVNELNGVQDIAKDKLDASKVRIRKEREKWMADIQKCRVCTLKDFLESSDNEEQEYDPANPGMQEDIPIDESDEAMPEKAVDGVVADTPSLMAILKKSE